MIDETKIESYKKFSYYCQSAYNSIQVYLELILKRKLELSNQILFKIIEDIDNMIKYYNNIGKEPSNIEFLNKKLEILFQGVENMDYYFIRDVFEYEMLPTLEGLFNEVKEDIYSIIS